MELRSLRYFITVAETLNFTRAAALLHMSQPPLSQQIKALEQELGATLFIRNPHKVELTEAGTALLQDAKQILAVVEQAKQRVQQIATGEVGHLHVGFLGSLTYDFLPQALRLYHSRYPHVELSLHEMGIAAQIQALTEGIIQIAFVGPVNLRRSQKLVAASILQDQLAVALPSNHPLVSRQIVRLRSLSQEPFIMLSRRGNPDFYDLVMRLCQSAKFTPNIVQETDRAQTLLNFVAAGFGVGIIPSRAQLLPIEAVVYKLLNNRRATMGQFMVWQREQNSVALQHFIEVVKEVTGAEFEQQKNSFS